MTPWCRNKMFELRRFLHDRRGATAVEFALTIPAALLLTVGALELGRAVFAQAAINHAAQETARFASVRGTASGMAATQASLEAMAVQLADLYATTAAVSWNPNNSPGGNVTVQLEHTFTPVTPLLNASSFNFSSTASMTIIR